MRPAEYLNIDPTGMVEAGHGPVVKVTASRASDGVTDRPMTSAERVKLHRRRLGLRPVQVIVSQQDIDYLLEARRIC
jgi:hypothetical protein